MTALLSSLIAATEPRPFAVIHREHEPTVDVLVGDVVDVRLLADIPLDGAEVVALVPFRQVRERGFDALDDGAPIRCLIVRERETVQLEAAVGLLPRHPVVVGDLDVDVSDDDYAATVRRVIDDEIGRGEGANFVIRREFTGSTDAAPATAVLGWLRALLEHESGAYWTFALHTPGLSAAGATPERHVSSIDGTVSMNPISGTFRHGDGSPGHAREDDRLLAFLHDVKEREELVMVVDEELKMMSAVCPGGGRIRGPFLKRMSRLTHTEYLLEGRSDLDPREVLRRTMFAPTVTGSPMGNACAVIARHETTPRGYYAGVLARFTPRPDGYDLDAPILIRTAYIEAGGRVRVPVGATLVRHSDPAGEVAETRAKAAGVLTALGALPRVPAPATRDEASTPSTSRRSSPRATTTSLRSGVRRRTRVHHAGGTSSCSTRATTSRRCSPTSCVTSVSPRGWCRGTTHPSRHPRISSCSARAPATPGTSRIPGSRGSASSWPPDSHLVARCWPCASATRCSPSSRACRSNRCRPRGRAYSSRWRCSATMPPSASTTPSPPSPRTDRGRRGWASRWRRMPQPASCTRCAVPAWLRCRATSNR